MQSVSRRGQRPDFSVAQQQAPRSRPESKSKKRRSKALEGWMLALAASASPSVVKCFTTNVTDCTVLFFSRVSRYCLSAPKPFTLSFSPRNGYWISDGPVHAKRLPATPANDPNHQPRRMTNWLRSARASKSCGAL